jgi:hypothetical protein
MSAVASEPWCRACGSGAGTGDAWCGQCGVPLEPPDPRASQFNQWVERQRYATDRTQREAIQWKKADILGHELVPLPRRLHGFVAALDQLPLDDRDRENRRLISDMVSEMEAEIARLWPSTR